MLIEIEKTKTGYFINIEDTQIFIYCSRIIETDISINMMEKELYVGVIHKRSNEIIKKGW